MLFSSHSHLKLPGVLMHSPSVHGFERHSSISKSKKGKNSNLQYPYFSLYWSRQDWIIAKFRRFIQKITWIRCQVITEKILFRSSPSQTSPLRMKPLSQVHWNAPGKFLHSPLLQSIMFSWHSSISEKKLSHWRLN